MATVATAAIASSIALGAYLDAKFHLQEDINSLRKAKAAKKIYQKNLKFGRISPWLVFAETVTKYRSHTAIWTRQRTYTYAEVHDYAARLAQWFLSQGIRPGELVSLYMTNSPDIMIAWLACLCIGCAPAFVNYNLEDRGLLHSLDVAGSKLLLVDEDTACQARIGRSRQAITDSGTKIVTFDDALRREIGQIEAVVPGDEYRLGVKPEFPLCLSYTSGTTGLPKGCAYTTERAHLSGAFHEPRFGGKPGSGGDRWYDCMPLYHGTGGITAIYVLMGGLSLAIGKRFSVTNFWKDIHDSQATMFVYVGECARYLLSAPVDRYERDHKIRCCYGNGLRPDVWGKFQERFNIPEIGEFFSSSEGMFSMVNWDKGDFLRGYVGRHGAILRFMYNDVFVPVLIDHETGDIWRDRNGHAKRMSYEEGGEIIVKIGSEKAFQGYWGAEEATRKKFVRDVFRQRDLYYRTGDALRRDPEGRWSFIDRLGDTFRWKSENVSTEDVAMVLGQYPGVVEANVYGVLVPGHDGRAGCAALHLEHKDSFDFDAFLKFVRARLPRYAVPVFIRKVDRSTHTHNLKQNKVGLRREGIEPNRIGTEVGTKDVVLWVPPREDQYVEFTIADWDKLVAGSARL